jgi:hypothetical protein
MTHTTASKDYCRLRLAIVNNVAEPHHLNAAPASERTNYAASDPALTQYVMIKIIFDYFVSVHLIADWLSS